MEQAMNFVPLILLIFIMYFLLIRPQKKRERETAQMRNSLQVGDEIVTIGGICGKIVKLKDDSVIVQVGADKVKLEVMRWGISRVVSGEQAKGRADKTSEASEAQEDAPRKVVPKKLSKKSAPEAEAAPADEAVESEMEAMEK